MRIVHYSSHFHSYYYCGFSIICDYLKSTSWNLKFRALCLVTIDQHIVERCVLLGRAEILVIDIDTIVH